MATLGNVIRFCSVNRTAFLGLNEGRNENEIVVSNTQTTVTIYETKDHKAITNYTLSGPYNLAASVVFSTKQKRYLAPLSNKELRVWTDEQRNISRGKRINIDFDIDSVWCPCVESDPLIVCKNGTIKRLTDDNDLDWIVGATDDEDRVSFVDVLSSDDQIHVAYIVTTKENEISCRHFMISRSEHYKVIEHHVSSLAPSSESTVLGFCLVCSDDDGENVNLLRLETDGNLHTGVLDRESVSIKWSCRKLSNTYDESKLTTMISLKRHIVIAQQTDESNIHCTVYNLQYGAPTHHKVVKECNTLTALKLYRAHDNLLLLGGEDVYLIPYSYGSFELSRLIGTKPNVKENGVELFRNAQNLKWTREGLKQEADCGETNCTASDTQFSTEFMHLVTDIQSDCVADQVVCSNIFNELTKAQKFKMLEEAFKYYKNVPELTLVNVLTSYLKYEDEQNHVFQKCDFDKDGKCNTRLLPLIDQILTVPINDLFLQEHVRKLPFDQVIFLLRYLHSFLKCFCHLDESDWTTVTKFVEWISILVDAHFHYLIVMKNDVVHGFLRDLQSTVVHQCQILECLAKIQELMWIVKCRAEVDNKTARSGYCIETLHFLSES